jgi:hypothetical protein
MIDANTARAWSLETREEDKEKMTSHILTAMTAIDAGIRESIYKGEYQAIVTFEKLYAKVRTEEVKRLLLKALKLKLDKELGYSVTDTEGYIVVSWKRPGLF